MSNYQIILILGPSGAGKTTVSEELAKRFKRSVFIKTDNLRHMKKKGFKQDWVTWTKKERFLSTKNASDIAKNFIKDKYNVIIEDVVTEKPQLDFYLKLLKSYNLKIILLLPSKNTVKLRDKQRIKEHQMGKRALELHDMFSKRIAKENRWHVLDTSHETSKVTTNKIYALLSK